MKYDLSLRGMTCPIPLLKTQKQLKAMVMGDLLEIVVTDRNTIDDLKALTDMGTITLLSQKVSDKDITILIRKDV